MASAIVLCYHEPKREGDDHGIQPENHCRDRQALQGSSSRRAQHRHFEGWKHHIFPLEPGQGGGRSAARLSRGVDLQAVHRVAAGKISRGGKARPACADQRLPTGSAGAVLPEPGEARDAHLRLQNPALHAAHDDPVLPAHEPRGRALPHEPVSRLSDVRRHDADHPRHRAAGQGIPLCLFQHRHGHPRLHRRAGQRRGLLGQPEPLHPRGAEIREYLPRQRGPAGL